MSLTKLGACKEEPRIYFFCLNRLLSTRALPLSLASVPPHKTCKPPPFQHEQHLLQIKGNNKEQL